jgi:hypothetical protein
MRSAKTIFLLTILLCSMKIYAQDPMAGSFQPLWPVNDSSLHYSITFSGEYTAGSDAISNAFLNAFYTGEYLDSGMKAYEENRLLSSNRFGAYGAYGTTFAWRNNSDTLRWELAVSIRDRNAVYSTFSADAFRLVFEGNRPFIGMTANLDNTKMTYMHWQQLQFEAKYFSPDRRSKAAFGFSLLSGQQLQHMNIREGKIFTASDGTALDISTDATYYASDTGNTGSFSRNGSGTCFNFNFSTILSDSASKFEHHIYFSVQDLGYIRWNTNSLIYNVDTSVHFTGVDATEAFFNDSNLTGLPTSDSLIGQPVRGQVITFLPVGLHVNYILKSSFHWWAGISARFWSNTGALPQTTLFGGWSSKNEKINLVGGASWGGFARLQIPLQLFYSPCKNLAVRAGTTNALGYIIPKSSTGQGAYISVGLAF